MVTSFNKQWVWFHLFNYTQLIISGLGAALTAKIDKSNTVRTTNITMQSLKSILRLWKFIGSIMLVFLLKSQLLLVCFIIFSPHFNLSFLINFLSVILLSSKAYIKKEKESIWKLIWGWISSVFIWEWKQFSNWFSSSLYNIKIK